ncbi:MAG: glycosyl hydrolase [Phycisphaerae bacterium]
MRTYLLGIAIGLLAAFTLAQGQETPDTPLSQGFAEPPLQARTRAYWWWLNGNVDKAAITKDLEWMKKIGMGGGLIFDAGGPAGATPVGPVFGSPQWRELFKHAVVEADRLGLQLSLSPMSGWNLGGPPVKPEQAAKHITWSEQRITGPTKFAGKLTLPPHRDKFYQDQRVVAYRLKPEFIGTLVRPVVTASSSDWPKKPWASADGQPASLWNSAARRAKPFLSSESPEWLAFEFEKPVTLGGIRITPHNVYEPRQGQFQIGEDGKSYKTIQPFTAEKKGAVDLKFEPVQGRQFRLLLESAFDTQPDVRGVAVAEVTFLEADGKALEFGKSNPPVQSLESKAMYQENSNSGIDDPQPYKPGDEDALASDVIDLSDKLETDGTLRWDVPDGTWQIMRFGCTVGFGHVSFNSGQRPGWTGYVVDYLDADALKSYWREVVQPLLDEIRPYLGKSFHGIETDSWEGGGINWTAKLPQEFKLRRGYDLAPYLPVFAGKIIQNRKASNRFLYDLRKTVGEMMADNHYGVMQKLAAEQGLIIHCEAGGPHGGPFDALRNWGRTDWPMGEFWVDSPHRPREDDRFFMKGPASAAHIYGKPIACGEGFTSVGPHWADTLWSSQKPTFDHEACAGLNLTYWHAFTCSPESMGMPGQEYFAGTHFNPQVTWANMAHAFIAYLNRCQFLLQQGQFVADVCYYYGDQVPNVPGRKQTDPAKVLPEYDYDFLNEEVLLRMRVKDGRLVLPHGMSYRLLALPNLKNLSLSALRKVNELVQAGATVVGPRPQQNPSQTEQPAADAEFNELCESLWGTGKTSTKPVKAVLASLGVGADMETVGAAEAKIDYIHRRTEEAEIYFVSNPSPQTVKFTSVFRVSGKQPELWDAVSGSRRPATEFVQQDGRTRVPLELPAYGSIFVIFRGPPAQVTDVPNFPAIQPLLTLAGAWNVSFDSRWGGPEKPVLFEKLEDWTKRAEEGIKYYSGTATYRKTFDVPSEVAKSKSSTYLDLGLVREMARVKLNCQDLGVVWCPPWRVEIGKALKPGSNELEIEVVNNWPNRLIGDGQLPPTKRIAKTHYTGWYNPCPDGKPKPLFESGLLGPVQVLAEQGATR